MLIINQDSDQCYNLSTKDIITTTHHAMNTAGQQIYTGWNMYGRTPKGLMLLGSFETPEFCEKVFNRIARAEAEGQEYYMIPEEPENDEPMFDWYNVASMWSQMEFAMDCTIEVQPPDRREVEPFGLAVPVDLVIYESGMCNWTER